MGDISKIPTELTKLYFLDLSSTSVSGDIGSIPTQFTSLEILDLSDTQVSGDIGSIPTQFTLSHLNLSTTSVSGDIGTIPTEFTSLGILDLSSTSVSGYISTLTNTKFPMLIAEYGQLFLSNNKLKGEIPLSFNALNQLDLSHNCLTMDKATADVFKDSDLYKGGNYTDPTAFPYLNLDYNCINGITDFKGITNQNCIGCKTFESNLEGNIQKPKLLYNNRTGCIKIC